MRDHLKMLIDYTYWAHRRIWTHCILPLSEAQFMQPLGYSVGSIHHQLVHTMSAEWMWLSRLQGTSPRAMFAPDDFPTREAIRERWDTLEAEMRASIDALPEDAVPLTFTYTTTTGKRYTQRVSDIIHHIVNHGTDHRAQTLAMLSTLGAATIDQDLIVYLRSRVDA